MQTLETLEDRTLAGGGLCLAWMGTMMTLGWIVDDSTQARVGIAGGVICVFAVGAWRGF